MTCGILLQSSSHSVTQSKKSYFTDTLKPNKTSKAVSWKREKLTALQLCYHITTADTVL